MEEAIQPAGVYRGGGRARPRLSGPPARHARLRRGRRRGGRARGRFCAPRLCVAGPAHAIPGRAFLPASIQFTTYGRGPGRPRHADGRAAGEPLADSLGAVQGRDTAGPTALLRSVAKLPLQSALGTPVLNLRLQKQFSARRPCARWCSAFEEGGMQVQISCLSREEILDAMAHPEKLREPHCAHRRLFEYFNRLTPELKQTVLKRTEFGA